MFFETHVLFLLTLYAHQILNLCEFILFSCISTFLLILEFSSCAWNFAGGCLFRLLLFLGISFLRAKCSAGTFSLFSWLSSLRSLLLLQSDDLKLHHEQSEYWTIFMLSEDIVVKHGWRNSRILRAISLGQGKLTASLTYFSGHRERKKVRLYSTLLCGSVAFTELLFISSSALLYRFLVLRKKLWYVIKWSSVWMEQAVHIRLFFFPGLLLFTRRWS